MLNYSALFDCASESDPLLLRFSKMNLEPFPPRPLIGSLPKFALAPYRLSPQLPSLHQVESSVRADGSQPRRLPVIRPSASRLGHVRPAHLYPPCRDAARPRSCRTQAMLPRSRPGRRHAGGNQCHPPASATPASLCPGPVSRGDRGTTGTFGPKKIGKQRKDGATPAVVDAKSRL